LYTNKNKIHKNWHYIDSKVQLAEDSSKMTRRCRTHVTTTTMTAEAIADRVAIADSNIQACNSIAL